MAIKMKTPKWVYRIRRFFKLCKVAIHKPYMLKAVLTTKCPYCKRWFTFPKIMEQNTRYPDDYSNYFCGCKDCETHNEEYWDAMWQDYYGSVM